MRPLHTNPQGRIASFMCGEEPLGPLRVWLRDINVPGLVSSLVAVADSSSAACAQARHPMRARTRLDAQLYACCRPMPRVASASALTQCMTRSFGDYVAASVGVLDTPQVTSVVLRPEDK